MVMDVASSPSQFPGVLLLMWLAVGKGSIDNCIVAAILGQVA